MPKKLLKWAGIAFAVFFIATNPTGAASLGRKAIGGVETFATSLATFFAGLA